MAIVMQAAILFVAALLAGSSAASTGPIRVVVAENVYGEAVERVGGGSVSVAVILNNPLADPHDYEPTPSAARMVSDAAIVIYNGLGYDAWMERLLAAGGTADRFTISVAKLLNRPAGDNPHLWYHPLAMPALADAMVAVLSKLDPAGAAGYADRGHAYKAELARVDARIAAIRAIHAGTPVTATEPVVGYLSQALALQMRHPAFQRAIMNETEPAARDLAAVERDLRSSGVKLVFFNVQVVDPLTEHLMSLAKSARIPIVPVTETKPPGVAYVAWMLGLLDAVETALADPQNGAAVK